MLFFFLMLSFQANASVCESTIFQELDLEEMFVSNPIVLPNQNIAFSRQNKNDWIFVKPDGTTSTFAPPSGTSKAGTLLSDGTLAIASKDGKIHFLDQDANHLRDIPVTKDRYIWHLAERKDGMLTLLSNRVDGRLVFGSTIFIDQNGLNKVELDLKKNGVWSQPKLLPYHSIALKTETDSVFIIRQDASFLQLPAMGGNGSNIIDTLSDGTILTGGRFGKKRKLLFIDPIGGNILSEMNWDLQLVDQDILFVKSLGQNHFVVSFSEHEKVGQDIQFNERLEFYDHQKIKTNEFKIKNIGLNTDWGFTTLEDGTLAHGAEKTIYFFNPSGEFQDSIELPFIVDKAPVLMRDGTLAVIGAERINGQRESHLFKIRRTCKP